MTRTISQRELRNDSARIIRELQTGTTFILTNNGEVVGQLVPLYGPQRLVPKAVLMANAASLPPVDVEGFMQDVDGVIDQTIRDPYTGEPA